MASNVLNLDGIALRHWQNVHKSKIPSRGYVWLVHGLGEHSGRYEDLATYLCQYGWDVLALDLPGHGLTLKNGVYTKLMGPKDMLPILNKLRIKLAFSDELVQGSSFIKMPKFLVGHSLGALICSYWLSQNTEDSDEYAWRSAFLSAPPFELKMPVPSWKLGLSKALLSFAPDLKIGNEISTSDLSVEKVNQLEYNSDPLVHHYASSRLFWDMRESSQFCLERSSMIETPLCLAVGSLDPIVSSAKIKEYYESLNTHKKYLEFSKSKHEIFNDIEKSFVYEALAKWMVKSI